MILVTGAAGYIGSHLIYELQKKYKIIGIDNFSNSSYRVISSLKKKDKKKNFLFKKEDCTNLNDIAKIFQKNKIRFIIHCAALKNVNESMKKKSIYNFNNVKSTNVLIDLCKKYDVNFFIHCSTAAVYDVKNKMPLKESSKIKGISIYAKTKIKCERNIIKKFKNKFTKYFIIRFFNPIGLNKEIYQFNDLGKGDLVTNIKKSLLKKDAIKIYGNNWPTKDGTAIRDFFSILDLISAIIKLIKLLDNEKINQSLIFNLGSGREMTVLQMINKFEKISKSKIKYHFTKKLKHEIYKSLSSIRLAKKILKWKPRISIESALKSSWNFTKKHKAY